MAERALYSALQKLAELLIVESLFLYGVRGDVEWLQHELEWMQKFLIDAEAKGRGGSEMIKHWLRKVTEVAHRAEDIIDTFTHEIDGKRGFIKRFKWMECFLWLCCFPCELISLHKVGKEIKGLKAVIDHIKRGKEEYKLTETTTASAAAAAATADENFQRRRRIYRHLNDSTTLVVGLDVHAKNIADRLLDPNIKRRSVVSIVGIGGLGKTTLANKVYNDNEFKGKFDALACISVSQDYKVLEIYKELLKQMKGKTMAELRDYTVDELAEMLREFLMKKRYLIVLDDVWGKDVWDRLIREALPEVYNGSRVLLTTRLLDLAKSIDRKTKPYELPLLNEDESWTLFINKTFLPRCPQELEGIGSRLVKRCGGLPLALEVLGGILASKEPNSVAWTSVAEHFDWCSTDDGGDCSKILGLSYDNLPHHHLKSCFLYLGVFPEDSLIYAQELIELWIAEGFIPQLETQMMEDTANAYLEELEDRSMIQVVRKNWLGGSAAGVQTLRIHDLFRDLCIREAKENDIFNIHNMTNSITSLQDTLNGKNLRRLVVHGDVSNTAAFMPPPNLKSILQFGNDHSAIIIPNGLKLLRVFHFTGTDNNHKNLPDIFAKTIAKMRLLRYLRSSGRYNLKFLPPGIRNLRNLQTLDLSGEINSTDFVPDWLGEMRTLRHVYFNRYDGFSRVSCLADVGSLTNLQTLEAKMDARGWMERGLMEKLVNIRILKVILNFEEEQGRVMFIDSLRKMKYLSYLSVYNEAGVIPIESFFSGLSENTNLNHLFLEGTMSVRQQLPADSLHGSGFPPNLTILMLRESKLVTDPMATLEKLPHLRVLRLLDNSYVGKEMVCTSGGFPQLQHLYLSDLYELEEWRVEDGAMPNLNDLHISKCTKLTTLPDLQHLRSLRSLYIFGYPENKFRPKDGEDWYKIQYVPRIRVYSQ